MYMKREREREVVEGTSVKHTNLEKAVMGMHAMKEKALPWLCAHEPQGLSNAGFSLYPC